MCEVDDDREGSFPFSMAVSSSSWLGMEGSARERMRRCPHSHGRHIIWTHTDTGRVPELRLVDRTERNYYRRDIAP